MESAAALVFARCAGFFFRAPGFSHPSVAPVLRAGLALVLTIALVPAMHGVKAPDGLAFVVALATEFAIGTAIGIAASLLYDGAYAGGRALDDYVGIRGSVPTAQVFAASGFGRIWSLLFTIGFFLLGGYRIAILVFAQSFSHVPPGGTIGAHALYRFALVLPVTIVEAALLVAGPAIALVLVTQLTLGMLTRVIPRFASFTLSFPLVFGAAVIATLAALPLLFEQTGRPWIPLAALFGR